MNALSLPLAIVALGFLIAIHEAGHMLVGKWCGMRVLRYSIGFGRPIWSTTRGDTTYQLCWIPFGGYVVFDQIIPGEEHENPEDPKLFDNRPVWARMAAVFAGPATNYLFAFLLGALIFGALGSPKVAEGPGTVVIDQVSKGKPADQAGLKARDVITHADGRELHSFKELQEVLQLRQLGYRYQPDKTKRLGLVPVALQVKRGPGSIALRQPLDPKTGKMGVMFQELPKGAGLKVVKLALPPSTTAQGGLQVGDVVTAAGEHPVKLVSELSLHNAAAQEGYRWAGKDSGSIVLSVKRDGDRITREVRPAAATGLIGVRFEQRILWERTTVGKDLQKGLGYPIWFTGKQIEGFRKLIGGDKKVAKSAAGPVGIVVEIKKRIASGWAEGLLVVIMLSALLGFLNLFPLPALDGSRLVFLAFEAITRRRVRPMIEARIHQVGLLLLLGLLVLMTYRDITKMF